MFWGKNSACGINQSIEYPVSTDDYFNPPIERFVHVIRGLDDGIPLDAVALDLREALDALGEISGEITSADILNEIFSDFCVGK